MKIKRYVGGTLESNGYIISNKEEGNCYIIDPGYEPGKFINYIEEKKLEPQGILLTHHHYDHVGAVDRIQSWFDIPVSIHQQDAFYLKKPAQNILDGGERLDLNGEVLQVIHTPGHTMGSVCFLSEKSKVIFTGDTIFDTDLGRTDLEDGSPEAMIQTCRNVINHWSNEYTIYPGHDGSATMKQVRKYNQEFLDCLEENQR